MDRVYEKSVINIHVENSPVNMSQYDIEDSILLNKEITDWSVTGNISNGSGTITVTCPNGLMNPWGGSYPVVLILPLRNRMECSKDFEAFALYYYYVN